MVHAANPPQLFHAAMLCASIHFMSSRITLSTYSPFKAQVARIAASRVWLLAALLLGFALRLYQLGGESLWYDETVSVYLATQPITDLIAHTARDIHPPAYYLLLYVWRLISAPSVAFGLEFLYAWPNLSLDMLVIALTYAITKRIFGDTAARWAIALTLLHPVQIWFAQEVRMYALGAFCLMLSLWAVTPLLLKQSQKQEHIVIPRSTRILYPLASIIGLYTLYYFLFWLLPLNIAILLHIRQHRRAIRTWIMLQLIVLIGWSPWIPTFIRQVITPPVPAWRVPWQNVGDVLHATSDALAALWVGHIPPLGVSWPWALLVLIVALLFIGYTKKEGAPKPWLWLTLGFAPTLLLIVISLIGPPVFHVRYVSTYAPILNILLAASLASLRLVQTIVPLILIIAISAASLNQLWHSRRNDADDHRTAVATLAQQWRPGDAILVNAGWAYTALEVYWPTELASPNASRPPALAEIARLTQSAIGTETPPATTPTIYRTGSINGAPSLGWDLPESDFFAISPQETFDALARLTQTHPRIWHYRIYDTVSDPDGLIRQWLNDYTTQLFAHPLPGRDYLLLEAYATDAATPSSMQSANITFPDLALRIINSSMPTSLPAGETLYVSIDWLTAPEFEQGNTALSLRLLDSTGRTIVQQDTQLEAGATQSLQTLALPIPADTIPSAYQVGLVVYSPATLAPFAAVGPAGAPIASPLPLGDIAIQLPLVVPHTDAPLATFDYIELLQATFPTTPLEPGAVIESSWTWHPKASTYRDHYRADVQLVDAHAQPVQLASFDLGGTAYPSSVWPSRYPVQQREPLTLPADLAPGKYTVQLTVVRVTDGQVIQARQPWQPWSVPAVDVGTIEVVRGE